MREKQLLGSKLNHMHIFYLKSHLGNIYSCFYIVY